VECVKSAWRLEDASFGLGDRLWLATHVAVTWLTKMWLLLCYRRVLESFGGATNVISLFLVKGFFR